MLLQKLDSCNQFFMSIEHISFGCHKFCDILGFPITNTFILTLFVGVLIFVLLRFGMKERKIIPSFFQNFVEWAMESILKFVDGITGDKNKTNEIFPIATTLFVLILFANLIEIVPGLGIFCSVRRVLI
jgi:F-type H+-transporting ATPase subunit a